MTSVPAAKQLFGEIGAISCVALRYVYTRLEAEGIFAPWIDLDESGEVSTHAARELFTGWYAARPRLLELMAQPKIEGRPIHGAALSFGGASLFGGEDGNFDTAASLFPPIVFGKGCIVRAGARLGGPCIFGDEVRVGSSHISRTIIFRGVKIASKVVIGDSIVGPGARIESGVSIRSQSIGHRASDSTIMTRNFKNNRVANMMTNRKVLGAIIGAGSVVEGDLAPGTVLMPGCHIRPWMRLPSGIYTPQILDGLHREWELRMLADIRGIMTPIDPES